ncbi:hypothetical protein B5S25_01975 [Paenibacillus larvae subsp. pulvifaciens]|nr:hypothetical protein B5S25_01975 [Paenibacillus larvae subsp. pulvifaciens]MBH0342778.1 hypothetical protein [Paenibacillus larvae]MBH0342787.1 hypothetical protein [Paenibacillus larvae]
MGIQVVRIFSSVLGNIKLLRDLCPDHWNGFSAAIRPVIQLVFLFSLTQAIWLQKWVHYSKMVAKA